MLNVNLEVKSESSQRNKNYKLLSQCKQNLQSNRAIFLMHTFHKFISLAQISDIQSSPTTLHSLKSQLTSYKLRYLLTPTQTNASCFFTSINNSQKFPKKHFQLWCLKIGPPILNDQKIVKSWPLHSHLPPSQTLLHEVAEIGNFHLRSVIVTLVGKPRKKKLLGGLVSTYPKNLRRFIFPNFSGWK